MADYVILAKARNERFPAGENKTERKKKRG